MISPSDPEYLATKSIKQGRAQIAPEFVELSHWIAFTFNCALPLNIVVDVAGPFDAPRLQIIFEFENDSESFRERGSINFDQKKQTKIVKKYLEMFDIDGPFGPHAERLFAVFSAFEPAARWEANSAMGKGQIGSVERSLASPMIWLIRPMFSGVTFFFHTDAQLKMTEDAAFRQRCLEVYSKELASHDEFGYFAKRPIGIRFESKETFERDYAGSWFAFDR